MMWFMSELPDFLLFRGFFMTSFRVRLIWIAIYPLYALLGIIIYPIYLSVLFTEWGRSKYYNLSVSIGTRKNRRKI